MMGSLGVEQPRGLHILGEVCHCEGDVGDVTGGGSNGLAVDSLQAVVYIEQNDT